MSGSFTATADVERRESLLSAAAGLHPASPAVAAAQRAPAVKVPRFVRPRRAGLDS